MKTVGQIVDIENTSAMLHTSLRYAAPKYLVATLLLLSAQFASGQTSPQLAIDPTGPRLETNIGPLWVDQYSYTVINANSSIFPACSPTLSVRSCMQNFLSYYARQDVTGIRFQFAVGGGAGSTPFDSKGNVSAAWLENLQAFFSDVKAAGIENVTPTSTLNQSWTGSAQGISLTTMTVPYQSGTGCPVGTETVSFFPWLPYGLNPNDPSFSPADKEDNQAYYCSPKNPIFWGWTPFFNLVEGVAAAAKAAGVNIEEWDIENEIDLWNFTIEAREIYDPITNTPVLYNVGQILARHGFASGTATYSVVTPSPSVAGAACDSMYGDSGYAIWGSELLAAETGGYIGSLGDFPNAVSGANGNLLCGGTTSGMITIPKQPPEWKPAIFDFHVYVCVAGDNGCDLTQDITSTSEAAYNGISRFVSKRITGYKGPVPYLFQRPIPVGNTSRAEITAMIGETDSGAPDVACDGHTPAMATENAKGFQMSDLFTQVNARTVIRPWAYLVTPGGQVCQPVLIGLPDGIYANLITGWYFRNGFVSPDAPPSGPAEIKRALGPNSRPAISPSSP
jgi:hypothetical protein